ncbi:hypothetical protein CFOL_v3_13454 [Cephalotus follicularis]|uniref:Uncharacterized protein n=1 Tax=Cephalotus follicularis TaxID=3775 RepID=A0A1Q3BQ16_CEPFO|nr:hypothetical protein CFOL_v3_13454 [Cephalotus follicularis]
MVMFARVASEDQPSTGLLCISHCVTCPVICSPPPAAQESHPPPSTKSPPIHHSPPQSYYHSPPPPLPPKQSPSVPWTYPSWSTPPPPSYYNNPPGSGLGPPHYPYPYYYFYTSKTSCPSSYASLLLVLFMFHALFLS